MAAESHMCSSEKKRNRVPKMRRFVIPMAHLGHRAFLSLLKETEEEFGFRFACLKKKKKRKGNKEA
ncbi:unnamed protein product [Spirodela intermedia]|uniref:Uncharacterized protein n=2 Tax=Spirodela intermedia TaxID=51605 RepID=A0A7I8LHP7_SPIIN|nr:unnamed protein product [Spirodela intermedia]